MFRLHFFLLTCCLLVHLRAESESQLLLRYEVFRMPKAAAEALQKGQPKAADIYAAVQQSVATGSASADKMILLRTLSGQYATVKQAVEFPYLVEPIKFETEGLGEVLNYSPVVSDETNRLFLNIVGTSTRRGLLTDGKPTFPQEKVAGNFPATSGQVEFLGPFETKPNNSEKTSSVAVAFVTTTIQRFPTSIAERPENRTFRCQYEVVSLPQATALKLVQTTPDSAKLYGKVNELIRTKTATLETLQMVQAREEQKCRVDHIDEFPYASDFIGAQTVSQLSITDPALREQLLKPIPGKKPLPPPNAGSSLTIPPLGTTYEVRNLGDSLEIEASSNRDGSARVTVKAEKVRLLSMERANDVVHPSFGLQQISTTVRVQQNTPLLIGTMNRSQETGVPKAVAEPRVWLAFLTLRG